MKEGNAVDSSAVCTACGRQFTPKVRRLALVHPTLFGGEDRVCASCEARAEAKTAAIIKEINDRA